MTREEFLKKAKEDLEWSPGWEAIDSVFEKLYPMQEPVHFGTNLESRAMLGGDEYLDGYSIYTSDKGYNHIVTYGMTELYVEEERFGDEWNGWGYEMTMKLAETDDKKCIWAIDVLSNLARYTYRSERHFEPFQFIAGNGKSICPNRESMITALMIVEDTEAEALDTVYGRTEFMQVVGITERELEVLKADRTMCQVLVQKMIEDGNRDLVTDLERKKSYL